NQSVKVFVNRNFPETLKVAAIGPGTARALEESGFPVDFVPETYRAENLADGLKGKAAGRTRFLLIRASRGREILADTLREAGGDVTQVVAYSSMDVTEESTQWNPEIQVALETGSVDWVTVTSSAIASATVRLFGESLRKTRIVSISSLTSNVLRKLGFPPDAEAENADMPSLVAELKKWA
ncbi:MAG: uroporphyrinogen-III synthase, partial [Planctomycetia bacterium]|nr:uroporphyrinogen-III synthase [Planctomycetia bacterium]